MSEADDWSTIGSYNVNSPFCEVFVDSALTVCVTGIKEEITDTMQDPLSGNFEETCVKGGFLGSDLHLHVKEELLISNEEKDYFKQDGCDFTKQEDVKEIDDTVQLEMEKVSVEQCYADEWEIECKPVQTDIIEYVEPCMEEQYRSKLKKRRSKKPFSCGKCNKCYKHLCDLRTHAAEYHKGECRHGCGWCRKRFNQTHNLGKHVVKCTGEIPYTCRGCHGDLFISNKNKQKKILSDHAEVGTNKRLYKCESCHEIFFTFAHLEEHIRMYKGYPYGCLYCRGTFNRSHMCSGVNPPAFIGLCRSN